MPLFRRKEPAIESSPQRAVMVDYTDRLAKIGKSLDKGRCRSVVIVEVSDNYIIRAIDSKNGTPALTEWLVEDFTRDDARLSKSPSPSSYESILKAIGEYLDSRAASMVAIIECPSCYQIVGWQQRDAGGNLRLVPFEATLDRHTLDQLVSNNR